MGETTCVRCGTGTTHRDGDVLAGVCDPCLSGLVASGADELSGLLESQPVPAALIGLDMTVLAFNRRFGQLFGGDHELGGMRVGEAVDCLHTSSETPCGHAHHCPHCEVRRLVDLTRISGEKISRVRMSLRHKSGADQSYLFTTARRGGAVILTVGG